MKKRKGEISIIGMAMTMFCVLFLLIITAYQIQIHTYDAIKTSTEDALAASNLASAVIDLEEYGISQNIVIANPADSYIIYRDALKVNMGLDDSWYSIRNADVISGQVEVMDYIVYNVRKNDVEVIHFGQNSYSQVIAGGKGTVTAPNGKVIEATSIYSRITFPVDGMFHIRTTAVKDKLVDIVS